MATISSPARSQKKTRTEHPADNMRFDFVIALLTLVFMFGFFLDGWAHNHGMVDESFFTPWHAALYGTYGLLGMVFVGMHLYNVNRGYAFTKALPKGYHLTLVGVFIFAIGGFTDMLWHIAFGIEEDLEALLSPTHLTIAIAGFLLVTGPFLAAWKRDDAQPTVRQLLPAIISATAMLSVLMFMTDYAFIASDTRILIGDRPFNTDLHDRVGVTSFIITTTYTLAILLTLLRRWQVPFGTMTILLGISGLYMTWMKVDTRLDYLYIYSGYIITGLIIDVFMARFKPSLKNLTALRGVAFLLPFTFSLVFMGALHLWGVQSGNGALWWEIHMWLGVPVLAGLFGILLSLVAVPPATPDGVANA